MNNSDKRHDDIEFLKKHLRSPDEWDESCILTLHQTKQARALGLEPRLTLRCIKVQDDGHLVYSTTQDLDQVLAHMKRMSKPTHLESAHSVDTPRSEDAYESIIHQFRFNTTKTDLNLYYKNIFTNGSNYMAKIYKPYFTFANSYQRGITDGTAFNFIYCIRDGIYNGEATRMMSSMLQKWKDWASKA